MRPRPSKRSVVLALVRGYLTTLLAMATVSGRAHAQDRTLFNSDQIPRDLVVALMSYDGSNVPDILVGKVPPLLAPKLIVPPRSRVLGSQMSISQTVVVIDVPMGASALRLAIDSGLVQLGWKRGPSYYGAGGGFRPASARTPTAYCSNGQSLAFALVPEGLDASLLRYSITDDAQRCSPDLQQAKPMTFEFPTLIDPAGSDRSAPSCRTVRTTYSGPATSIAYRNALSGEEILSAYGKQLADSGWVTTPLPAGDRTVESRWRQTRAGSSTRYATLRVTQPAAHPECRVMELRIELDYSR
jgi:hypothetical protein